MSKYSTLCEYLIHTTKNIKNSSLCGKCSISNTPCDGREFEECLVRTTSYKNDKKKSKFEYQKMVRS
jgi:hypothetical protein